MAGLARVLGSRAGGPNLTLQGILSQPVVPPKVTPENLYRSVTDRGDQPDYEWRAGPLSHRLTAWKEAIEEGRVSVSVTWTGDRIVHVLGKDSNDPSADILLHVFADKLRALWEFEIHSVGKEYYDRSKFRSGYGPIKLKIEERVAANFIESKLREFYIETDTQLKSTWIAWVIAWFRESVFGSVPGRDFLNSVAVEPWHHTRSKGSFHYANAHLDFVKAWEGRPDRAGLF